MKVKRRTSPLVFGRGLGGLLLVGAVPGLLQLALETIAWRGVDIAAGGGLGVVIVENLESALGFVGTTLVLLALVMAGSALVIQSTLGELIAGLTPDDEVVIVQNHKPVARLVAPPSAGTAPLVGPEFPLARAGRDPTLAELGFAGLEASMPTVAAGLAAVLR